MISNSRISKIARKGAMFFLVLSAGINSGQAQTDLYKRTTMDTDNPISQMKTAGQAIRLVENVRTTAKAISLNTSINSPYEDIKPRLTPQGNRLYFSRIYHPGNTNGVNDPEDIWYSDFDHATNNWSEPIRMVSQLNNDGPNYINNVSATGDTVILGNQYLKKGKMRSGTSYSVNIDGQWSAPKSINIEEDYNMSQHANSFVALKSGVIIQAVNRVETVGERDLYVSFWDGEKASVPLNMGTVINTELEESSPYLAADNKTMYFASKGHNGYGGFDIYVTKRLDESWTNWSQPENLGPAVNGTLDDEFFSITQNGNFAIFSKQVNVHNVDLYRISMEDLLGTPNLNLTEDSSLAEL